uniref:Mavicyanin-like n=1 Tax=Tanacetum cinerariifolium TaxID=118510 RepID=A0A699J4X9_TANCI|nr:mavicyanin-like [Tanacetum cinerariifolium]
MAFTAAVEANGGEVYLVGEGRGWTSIGHIDYKTWAATKHFQVGDSIVFRYAKKFHNVVRVSYENYKSCNATNPYATYTSGNDIFTIRSPGNYFFICSCPGHCESGQKVDIRVLSTPAPHVVTLAAMEPLPFPYLQPHIPSPAPVKSLSNPAPPAPAAPKTAPSTPEDIPDADAAPQEADKSHAKQLETTSWATLTIILFYVI